MGCDIGETDDHQDETGSTGEEDTGESGGDGDGDGDGDPEYQTPYDDPEHPFYVDCGNNVYHGSVLLPAEFDADAMASVTRITGSVVINDWEWESIPYLLPSLRCIDGSPRSRRGVPQN